MTTRAQKRRIMESLTRKNGELILDPTACAEWLPGQDNDAAGSTAEAWAISFEELVVGLEYGRSRAMPKKTLSAYYAGLKAYQLEFWRAHSKEIKATVSEELLPEYSD